MKTFKFYKNLHFLIAIFTVILIISACKNSSESIPSKYYPIEPRYDKVRLNITEDTIHFYLHEDAYNKIQMFNVFEDHLKYYISFFDKHSNSLNIYDLSSTQLVKRISLRKIYPTSNHRIMPYVRSFDSIFINNGEALVLIDSLGNIMKRIDYLENPHHAFSEFNTTCLPVLKNNHFYTAVGTHVDSRSMSAIKKWKVLYDFNLMDDKRETVYHYPERYTDKYYGKILLSHSYCVNDKGRFVFSFAADTCIYETDLDQFHRAYLGKSQFQMKDIPALHLDSLKSGRQIFKNMQMSDSYGGIFFDPTMKRYLRVAWSGVTRDNFNPKERTRPQRLLIFDEKFTIIGESEFPVQLNMTNIFIAPTGGIYIRVNPNDENAIHFARLAYSDESKLNYKLTKR